jgi:heme exporter protein B
MRISNKESALIELFLAYTILGSIAVSLTCEYNQIKEFGIFFITILVPLFITQISDKVIYEEFKDGFLEFRLSIFSSFRIVLEKSLITSFLYIFAFLLILPLIFLLFNLSLNELNTISHLMIINIIMSVSISLFIGSCNCYFKRITLINFIVNIPIILPNLIITGLIITNSYNQDKLFLILYGIALIILPIIFYCSCFLIRNIYNISI